MAAAVGSHATRENAMLANGREHATPRAAEKKGLRQRPVVRL